MSKKFRNLILFSFLIVIFVAGVNFVFAQSPNIGMDYVGDIGLSEASDFDPRVMIVNVVRFILGFLGIIAVVMIMYGGWLWMTASGQPERIEKAKRTLIAAVIGLIIILAAFAIVTFVINFTDQAITGGGCEDGTTRDCGCGGIRTCIDGAWSECIGSNCMPGSSSFRVSNTIPSNEAIDVIRNVTVKTYFNKPIDASVTQEMLNNNFIIEKTDDIDPDTGLETPMPFLVVAGEDIIISSNRRNLSFKALAGCGDENNTTNCFDEWSKFLVTIDGSSEIVAAGPQALDCLAGTCQFVFSTNNVIDSDPPIAGIIPEQMCADDGTLEIDANTVGGWGRDDIGISELRFYDWTSLLVYTEPGTGNRYQFSEYQYNIPSTAAGQIYTFSLEADDMASMMAGDSFDALIRVGHCCNGVLDADEEEIDCGGVDCMPCEDRDPVIYYFSPDNGAPGNWITIGGRYFGTVPGQVFFWDAGASDFMATPADFPSDVNSNCISNWLPDQIIVVVPGGAASGSIKVIRSDGREDASNDSYGPLLSDFIVNTTVRPGLCLAQNLTSDASHVCFGSNCGYFEDSFGLEGTGFTGADRLVKFGNETSNITANNISNWQTTSVEADVPNINSGRNTVFVIANAENSNYLRFDVLKDIIGGPVIDYIDPPQGPAEQYITIYGSNFGSYNSSFSQVEFIYLDDGTVYPADGFDFPPECQDRWWYNTFITVKVPPAIGANIGDYEVTVTNRNNNTSDGEPFEVTTGTPGPGLCLLDPRNGPIGILVNMYGDNFEDSQDDGFVRFFSNISASSYPSWSDQNLSAHVPTGAQTGPVIVSNGSAPSNSMPFTVGKCSDDSECFAGEECCGTGSFWAGICRDEGTCGGGTLAESGYGWTFTTAFIGGPGDPCRDPASLICTDINLPECDYDIGLFCDPDAPTPCTCQFSSNDTDSCQGRSNRLDRCDPVFCPNSPGQCSPYTGGAPEVVGLCDDAACASVGACASVACTYNGDLNRCVSAQTCDLGKVVQDIFNNDINAYCDIYGDLSEGRWHINTSASCPTGWFSIGNNKCVESGTTCDLCDDGFSCYDGGGPDGVCAVSSLICPKGSVCTGGECLKDAKPGCECCCEIGYDARDCCIPLTCEGTCGEDIIDDGSGFGMCSGCAHAGATQAEHDAACNCEGSYGKYCDVNDPARPEGVCRDCSYIEDDSVECSNHSTACCFDANEGADNCRGLGGAGSIYFNSGINYCAYYSCETVNPYACLGPSETGEYYGDSNCKGECGASAPSTAGKECIIITYPLCSHGLSDCSPFTCLDEAGSNCRCCCEPGANDICDTLNPDYPNLLCHDDIAPCTGNNRGLCCGCVADANCGNPEYIGCGSDTCCHSRPNVSPPTMPADGETDVCRNISINVQFDQPMDLSSFSGNVIVVGDYGPESCPPGTEYLASAGHQENKNLFTRLYIKAEDAFSRIYHKLIFSPSVRAYTNPDSNRNYCAVKGSSGGYNDTLGNGVLVFNPSKVLDGDRLYYVIIKGDVDLNSSGGVLNFWGVGMNADSTSPSGGNNTFNGINYAYSYIWSFTTLPEQAKNNGICELSGVEIKPKSYLFQTTENDLNENDTNPNANSFDSVRDSDKVFIAKALSSEEQALAPIPILYNWEWSWNSSNVAVADAVIPNVLEDNARLIRTGTSITDGKTIITATVIITESVIITSPAGTAFAGEAEAYIFLCDNPWPPVAADGSWRPWRDDTEGMNCIGGSGPCYNTNYEVYYCRDAGNYGTVDDLPAILSDSTIIRGESDEILKEAYFLREDVPSITTDFYAGNGGTGGQATSTWQFSSDPAVDGYKLYWGFSSNNYNEYVEIDNLGNTDNSNVVCNTVAGPGMFCHINGLINNRMYYFNLTAYYDTGTESGYFGEARAYITDNVGPVAPVLEPTVAGDGEVALIWSEVLDDTDSYEVLYGINSGGPYGYSENIGNDTEIIIAGLTNGHTYYFVVRAVDGYDNKSPYSNERTATPMPLSCGNEICDPGECTDGCTLDCTIDDCCGIEGCNAGIGEDSGNCEVDCGG